MSETRTVQAACPHDCPDTCALRVTVEGDRAVAVAGDPDHPITAGFLCGKVAPYLERVYADDRILAPLVRSGPKGAGSFREATWDEALDLVAAGIRARVDRHGGETVLPYSFLGTQGLVQGDAMGSRLLHALGASRLERTICDAAAMAGIAFTHGPDVEVDPEEWRHARLVVLWGWNPISTAPHLWRQVLLARKAGARLVAIDPYRSRTARVADQHLQPLPGADGAVALGLMRAMLDAGLVDEGWCRAHAVGLDETLARLRERTVEECAALAGLDAGDLRALGEALATEQPSLIRLGVGAQRHAGAELAYRTIACVPALAGSWRHRGGGLAYSPVATFLAIDAAAAGRPDLAPGPTRSIPQGAVAAALADEALDPPVTALLVWNANPLTAEPDGERLRRGLLRDDLLTVVLEHFMTDTARYADVVLPATTQLEHADVVPSWGHQYLTWNEPAIAPRGQALPNSEIFRRLAARLGLTHPALAATDDDLLDELLGSMQPPVDRALLRRRGWVKVDLGQGPVPHAEGRFPTPSGRLELRSQALADLGEDPLPTYDPPAEIADRALAARFPLCLLTPKTGLFLNSTFGNGRRHTAAQPAPAVVLHPDDAASRGIAEGMRVRVWNERGAFEAAAAVRDDVRPGVAVAPHGYWEAAWGGPSCQATTPGRVTRIAHAPQFNDNRVEVAPA